MKNEKINTEIQNVNAEKNTANEKWETPEMLVFSVGETKIGPPPTGNDGLGGYS